MFVHEEEAKRAVLDLIRKTPQDDQFKMSLARVMMLVGSTGLVSMIGASTTLMMVLAIAERIRDENCQECGGQQDCELLQRLESLLKQARKMNPSN